MGTSVAMFARHYGQSNGLTKTRKKCEAAVKAKIGLEAVREHATIAELAKRHGFHGLGCSNVLLGEPRSLLDPKRTV